LTARSVVRSANPGRSSRPSKPEKGIENSEVGHERVRIRLGIILIGTIGGILKARYGVRKDKWGNETSAGDRPAAAAAETNGLRDEILRLRERVQVLERVVTDNESGARIDREIEKLRSKDQV
jgi:hypothetical protein